ncbi:hypothetical protein [Nocardioides sp. B-3]|uniref:hypothetical protein n=1 Tax=Nocardioides sp. B-3 TaxID=2895565 RepID=UPI002152AAFA|nr:hypothetical protein [Nocardioides sp. B-3]UUZ57861.1 hypothetical protein LP418_15900 [Nocardioides sp. B-3]
MAVVPPGEPQPPLAVADQLTVEPGRTAVFDPIANDYVAPGDEVKLRLVDEPEGVEIDRDTNLGLRACVDDHQGHGGDRRLRDLQRHLHLEGHVARRHRG